MRRSKLWFACALLAIAVCWPSRGRCQWTQVGQQGWLFFSNDTLYLHPAFLQGDDTLMSTDHGVTWSIGNPGGGDTLVGTHVKLGTVLFKTRAYWPSDTADGVLRSTDDGKTWMLVFNQGTTMATDGRILFTNSDSGSLSYSLDTGTTWVTTSVDPGSGGPAYLIAGSPGVIFGGYEFYDGRVYYSIDLGKSWTRTGTMHRVNNIVVSGPNIVVATGNTASWWAPVSAFRAASVDTHSTPDLSVVPNPTRGTVTVCATGLRKVQALNDKGVVVRTVMSTSLSGRSQIDLTQEPPGVYFISAQTATEKITQRVVKQ